MQLKRRSGAPQAAGAARALYMRPLALSAAIVAPLTAGAAVVQAGHRLGASLSLTGTDDAVFMSGPGIGLFPAHIVVRTRDLARVRNALQATGFEPSNSGAGLALRFDLSGVRLFRPRLAPMAEEMQSTRAKTNVAAAAQWLRAYTARLGLGATAAELLAPSGRWMQCLHALQSAPRSAEPALRSLIGRGTGTTPAGDDLLIGALAYAWARQGAEAPIVAAMRALGPELPALTTSAGASYLRAAARGEFGSHLIAWVRALPRLSPPRTLALALRVAGHGASSGYDTLAGVIGAAEAAATAPASAPPVAAAIRTRNTSIGATRCRQSKHWSTLAVFRP